MIATLLVTVLAVGPAADRAPAAECRACSLIAQAEVPPPLPPDAPRLQTEEELQSRVDTLNHEIRGINVNWPPKYIVMAYGGYVFAPTGIFGGGFLLLFGLLTTSANLPGGFGPIFLAVGGVGVLLGVLGVIAIIYAWTAGNAETEANRARRNELILERQRLEEQLRQMRRLPPAHHTVSAPVMLSVLRF